MDYKQRFKINEKLKNNVNDPRSRWKKGLLELVKASMIDSRARKEVKILK